MNMWLSSPCELQTDLILKEDVSTAKSRAHPRLSRPHLKILPLYGNFFTEKLSKRMLYHALNRVFRLLHSNTKISNIFYKINYDGQSRQVFSLIIIDGKVFKVSTENRGNRAQVFYKEAVPKSSQ